MGIDNNGSAEKQLLDKLLAERAELDQHIAFLQKRLGIAHTSETPSSTQSEFSTTVQKGEFFGLSRPAAAAAVLKKTRKPLTTNEIYELLSESAYDMSAKNSFNALYTALTRSADVRKVAPNTWGLKEWYPHLKETKKKNGAAQATDETSQTEQQPTEDQQIEVEE